MHRMEVVVEESELVGRRVHLVKVHVVYDQVESGVQEHSDWVE